MTTRLLALLCITLAAAACGPTGKDIAVSDPGNGATDSPTATATAAPVRHCTDDVLGYRLSYPADWHVNDGQVLPDCRLFDPEPIDIRAGTEIPFDIAVALRTSDHPSSEFTSVDEGAEILRTETTTVAGHDATIVDKRSTGAALLPAGMHFTQWVTDLGDTRLVASTHDTNGDDHDYDTNRRILGRMMANLELAAGQHGNDG